MKEQDIQAVVTASRDDYASIIVNQREAERRELNAQEHRRRDLGW